MAEEAEDGATAAALVGATSGVSAGVSAGGEEDAGGGGGGGGGGGAGGADDCSAALVWICCASSVVEVCSSVGVTWAGASEVKDEVTAVRARERVHRLPLTVVTESCGVAMQKPKS